MGRAPCCEKMGLKKGPWTPEEDQVLINYIRLYGHTNWRALPKQAGLLRCGKSCRLRWINYLRPDIKRGNFTSEEEETIIELHKILGNRWSAIAAKLPGRTDNEIKNVWHTHLKKKIKQNINNVGGDTKTIKNARQEFEKDDDKEAIIAVAERSASPQQSSCNTDTSIVTISENVDDSNNNKDFALSTDFPTLIDESFWSDIVSIDNYVLSMMDSDCSDDKVRKIETWEPILEVDDDGHSKSRYSELYNDEVEFWFGVLTGAGELSDIPEF